MLQRPPPQNRHLKQHRFFLDAVISKVLRDLLAFSRNKPLKSADDWYMGILKNMGLYYYGMCHVGLVVNLFVCANLCLLEF